MKKGIHPPYGPVVFRDRTSGRVFLTSSTMTSSQAMEIDGVDYPVVDVDVTSDTHPFWTGRAQVMDTEGRVEAFRRRFGGRS